MYFFCIFAEFKEFITERNKIFLEEDPKHRNYTLTDRETLCWIELKNGVAISIYRQHTP